LINIGTIGHKEEVVNQDEENKENTIGKFDIYDRPRIGNFDLILQVLLLTGILYF